LNHNSAAPHLKPEGDRLDIVSFARDTDPSVRGFLHLPEDGDVSRPDAIVLTHGAGSNCQAPLLTAIAKALAAAGITVLRCDLPYRQKRPHGPPFPGEAARDRDGLRNAVEVLKAWETNSAGGHGHTPLRRIFLGGHSYGGRQASMLAAEHPEIASGLLLMSYPLHPPGQPSRLRTDHFPSLHADGLFVHGTRDPFASTEELELALKLIPSRTRLLEVEGAGHDLRPPSRRSATGGERLQDSVQSLQRITTAFLDFFA